MVLRREYALISTAVTRLTWPRFCVDSQGEDVQILVEEDEAGDEETHTDEHHDDDDSEEPADAGQHCHFHAGVE